MKKSSKHKPKYVLVLAHNETNEIINIVGVTELDLLVDLYFQLRIGNRTSFVIALEMAEAKKKKLIPMQTVYDWGDK